MGVDSCWRGNGDDSPPVPGDSPDRGTTLYAEAGLLVCAAGVIIDRQHVSGDFMFTFMFALLSLRVIYTFVLDLPFVYQLVTFLSHNLNDYLCATRYGPSELAGFAFFSGVLSRSFLVFKT